MYTSNAGTHQNHAIFALDTNRRPANTDCLTRFDGTHRSSQSHVHLEQLVWRILTRCCQLPSVHNLSGRHAHLERRWRPKDRTAGISNS